jgi:hypothetical protein
MGEALPEPPGSLARGRWAALRESSEECRVADFPKLVANLKSKRPSTRYDACEELRVAPAIPEDAILALRTACNDPDPGVAEAAGRALAIHISPSASVPAQSAVSGLPQSRETEPAIVTWGPGIMALAMLVLGWILVKDLECVGGLASCVIAPIIWIVVKLGVFRSLAQRQTQILVVRSALGGLAAFLGYALVYDPAVAVVTSPAIWGTGPNELPPDWLAVSLICAIPLYIVIGLVSAMFLRRAKPEENVVLGRYLLPHLVRSFIIGALLCLPYQFFLLFAGAF